MQLSWSICVFTDRLFATKVSIDGGRPMRESSTAQQATQSTGLWRGHPWLGSLLEALDAHLRHAQDIREYTTCPECVFRIQIIPSGRDVALADGTQLRRGERVIDLHLWNEHIPAMPPQGPTLAWARHADHCVDVSLRELARYLAARPSLADIRAFRANMSFGTAERSDQIARLVKRFGFEMVPAPPPQTLFARLHRLGENILIAMLVLARNAVAFRANTLWRGRTLAYLSRRELERRYGTQKTHQAER